MGHRENPRSNRPQFSPEAMENPEFRRLVEAMDNMTPEQVKLAERRFKTHMKEFGEWVEKFMAPRIVGATQFGGWALVAEEPRKSGRYCLTSPEGWRRGIRVIISGATYSDGRRWLHLSMSREDRIPSWDDITKTKERFFHGLVALQVFPPKNEWINVHPYTLNLWVCVTERVTPDFREDLGGGLVSI